MAVNNFIKSVLKWAAICCFIFVSTSSAQNRKDSILKSNLHTLDSTFQNKADNKNHALFHKLDSSFKKTTFDSNSQHFWNKPFKIQLPPKKTKILGQYCLAAFYTDVQNPRSLNEKQYIRLYGTPELLILGLPFSGNFNFTTEDNNLYNSNSFSLNFDKQKYLENLKQQASEQITGYKKELSGMNREIQKQHFEISNLKRSLEYEKRKIKGDSLSCKNLINTWEQELNNKISNENQELLTVKTNKQDSLYHKHRIDSLNAEFKTRVENLQRIQSKGDSVYNSMVIRYEELKVQYQKLEDQFEEAKKYVQKADSIISNPEHLLSNSVGQNNQSKFISYIPKIEKFNMGNINPEYGDLILNGIPIRGIDIKLQQNLIFKFTAGKTFSNLIPARTNNIKQLYNRNLLLGAVGLKNKYGIVLLNAGRIWDNENSINKHIFNNLLGLQVDYLFLKRLTIKTEVLFSDYKSKYNSETIVNSDFSNISNLTSFRDKFALSTNINFRMGSSTKLFGNLKRFSSQFTNIGNPYLRSDFQEYRIGLEQDFFKKKIAFSGFYYVNSDNLSRLNNFTNKTEGFGFQSQTNFSRMPNIVISYTPFIQGTYHPDSLLRSNNHFATKSITITYQKATKSIRYFFLTSYTDGVIQFGDEGIKMHNRSLQSMITLKSKKFQTNCSYTKSFTEGKIDTMSFDMLTFNANFSTGKYLTLGLQMQSAFFLNEGSRIYNSINFRYKFSSKLSILIQAGYNSIKNIWGIEQMIGFTGRTAIVLKL